jgi:hypothetical protein
MSKGYWIKTLFTGDYKMEDKMNLLEKYTLLNNSFKKELTFHLGTLQGFYSEYVSMILAMLYCLDNKIKFVLYSKDANFGYEKGWTDFFLPFCEEADDEFNHKYNSGAADYKKKFNPHIIKYHLLNRNKFLTFELRPYFRSKSFKKKQFYVPELGIDGGLPEACRVLINLTWRYNGATQNVINQIISSLHLPQNYVGFHIRSGDKYIETELLGVEQYVEESQNRRSDLKNAFILTDNYELVEAFNDLFKEWNVCTLCKKEEKGYFHGDFVKQNKLYKKERFENFFASIEVLNNATVFIGTFSSNVGLFMGMCRRKETTFGLDSDDPLMWLWEND